MASDPLIGQVLVGHVIEGVVGEGGMGTVYRARHARLGRMRALKLLPPRFADDESYRDRFEREWRSAAAIEHPNIVEVLDAGDIDGQLFIVMRLIEGPDLGKLLTDEGPLDPRRTLNLLTQIADALDAANERGLVHRDVKPSNILVGPGDTAYLTDFGVAKNTGTRGLTQKGMFVGTIDYAAPEQIEGQPLDGRTDVYALGGVLYTCLTGAVPYERESEVQVIYAHLRDPAPAPCSRQPELPPALDAVVAKAMDKSKENRYGSCGELIAGLRAALRARATEPGVVVPPAPTRIEELPEQPKPDATKVAEPPPAGETAVAAGGAETQLERDSEPGATRERPPEEETKVRERAPAEETVLAGGGAETRLERDHPEATTISDTPAERVTPPTREFPPPPPVAVGDGGRRRLSTGVLLGGIGGVVVLAGAVVALLLLLGGGSSNLEVKGKVVDAASGRPVLGVRVTAGDKSAETAGDGSFQLGGVAKDEPVSFESCAYTSQTLNDPATLGPTITLSPRPVRGTVRNGVTGRGLKAVVESKATEETQADGRFTLYGVCPGDSVHIRRTGFIPTRITVSDSRIAEASLQPPQAIRETFSAGSGWFDKPESSSFGSISLLNAAYHMKLNNDNSTYWASSPFDPATKGIANNFRVLPRDAALSVTTERYSGPELNAYGFICAYDVDHYYKLAISDFDGGQFTFSKVNGSPRNPAALREWKHTNLIRANKRNRLTAECTGGQEGRPVRLTLRANNRFLGQVVDRRGFPSRAFGLFAESFDNGGVEIEFDNFVFKRLG